MRNQIRSLCVPFVFALAACSSSGGKVDIGDDKRGTIAQSLADYAGSWDGYVEAYQFPGGTDRVRVTLDGNGQGTLEVGDGPPFAPPSDPTIGYPDPNDPVFADSITLASYALPRPGLSYPVHEAVFESGRIRFSILGSDPIAPWCEMQQSYLEVGAIPEQYSCILGGGYVQSDVGCFSGDGSLVPRPQLDCGQAKTCAGACDCTATECHGRQGVEVESHLDGALAAGNGDELVGTLVLPQHIAPRVTIRMSR